MHRVLIAILIFSGTVFSQARTVQIKQSNAIEILSGGAVNLEGGSGPIVSIAIQRNIEAKINQHVRLTARERIELFDSVSLALGAVPTLTLNDWRRCVERFSGAWKCQETKLEGRTKELRAMLAKSGYHSAEIEEAIR